jgi:outer membrane protein OmpA-like peptidoglycan-associated protein
LVKRLALALLCVLAPLSALAQPLSADQLQQQVQAFAASPDHIFAPATIAKAQAYVGAAMLASQQNKPAQLADGLQAASTALDEARQIAADYEKRHHDLLVLRRHAKQAVDLTRDPAAASVSQADTLFYRAEQTLNAAIAANEAGNLNTDNQKAGEAATLYRQAIAATLPAIVDQAKAALDASRDDYPSHYIPDLYGSAKEEVNKLREAIAGKAPMPAAPAHALILARKTQDMAAYIRRLRRQNDGYETLILGEAKARKQVAQALGEDVDPDDIATDVSNADLVKRATALTDELAQARQQYKDDLAALKAHDADVLAEKLAAQKQQLVSAQDTTLSSLKNAFKAKLAQETFESDRQAKLRKLFKPGEVAVYINLDGSLLVRLKALQFASGTNRIAKKYASLIQRLAKALALYNDRNYRIEGHTDNQGGVKSNQVLSLKRAEAVRNMLVADGVDAAKIKSFGYGEVRPIASNAFAKGRAMNRRIDVIIEAPAPAPAKP